MPMAQEAGTGGIDRACPFSHTSIAKSDTPLMFAPEKIVSRALAFVNRTPRRSSPLKSRESMGSDTPKLFPPPDTAIAGVAAAKVSATARTPADMRESVPRSALSWPRALQQRTAERDTEVFAADLLESTHRVGAQRVDIAAVTCLAKQLAYDSGSAESEFTGVVHVQICREFLREEVEAVLRATYSLQEGHLVAPRPGTDKMLALPGRLRAAAARRLAV